MSAVKKNKKSDPKKSKLVSKSDNGMKGLNFIAIQASSTNPDAVMYLYFKKHASSEDALPTLFVTNIPLSFDHNLVSEIFSCFGAVQEVSFLDDKLPSLAKSAAGGIRSAHVIYEEQDSLTRALEFDNQAQPDVKQPIENVDKPLNTGICSWMSEYAMQRPDADKLQFRVDKFMEIFDENERKAELAAKAGPVIDEDGFQLVPLTNKKRKQPLLTKADLDKKQKEAEEAKPKKPKVVLDFYRHQFRENKREQLADLRRKFAEDRQKIEKMKAARKFNPF